LEFFDLRLGGKGGSSLPWGSALLTGPDFVLGSGLLRVQVGCRFRALLGEAACIFGRTFGKSKVNR
jgi:hypothetical protein